MDKQKNLPVLWAAVGVAGILQILFFICCLRMFTGQVLVEQLQMDNAFVRTVLYHTDYFQQKSRYSQINNFWQTAYMPVQESAGAADEPKSGFAEVYNRWNRKMRTYTAQSQSDIQLFTMENSVIYLPAVRLGNRYDNAIGWHMPVLQGYNNVYPLAEKGYYASLEEKKEVSDEIEAVSELNEYLQSGNIPFVYAAAMRKTSASDADIYGIADFSNQNTDELTAGIRKAGVDCLDLRDVFADAFANRTDAFYKTDVHWTTPAAFCAAESLAKHLNEVYQFGIDLSVYENSRWEAQVYHDRMLGSQGRKITTAVAKPEDFVVLSPREECDLELQIPSRSLCRQGGFDIMLNEEILTGEIDYQNKQVYESFLYSSNSLVMLKNRKAACDKKVLILCDSFGRSFAPYFLMGVSSVDVMDLRVYKGSLKLFLEMNLPYDAVVVLYNAGAIDNEQLFCFE